MTKWEYKTVRSRMTDEEQKASWTDITVHDKTFEHLLNTLGADGWELVTHAGYNYEVVCTFKRPVA